MLFGIKDITVFIFFCSPGGCPVIASFMSLTGLLYLSNIQISEASFCFRIFFSPFLLVEYRTCMIGLLLADMGEDTNNTIAISMLSKAWIYLGNSVTLG